MGRPNYKSYNGRTVPILIELPVQDGSTQAIAAGEICKVRSITDFSTYPIIPASAGDEDCILVIAWQDQVAGDPARKILFAIPTFADLFEFAFDASTQIAPGTKLELASSTTFRDGLDAVVASVWECGDKDAYTAAGVVNSHTRAFVGFKKVQGAGSVGTAVQTTGSGLSDLTASGSYNGTESIDVQVKITTASTTDEFQYSMDGGTTWNGAGIDVTGGVQELKEGVKIAFAAATGHTLNDVWTIPCTAESLSGFPFLGVDF